MKLKKGSLVTGSSRGIGQGTSLELVHSFDVMWVAWVGYYPGTEIYAY